LEAKYMEFHRPYHILAILTHLPPSSPIKSFWKTMNTHRQLEMIYMLRWPCEVFNASLIQVYDLFAYNL
jgi:hypothetical protein